MRIPAECLAAVVIPFGLFVGGHGLVAQQRFSLAEIGQIADVVLERLIAPDSSLSCITVARRGVYFDHARTLQAFGYGVGARSLKIPLRSKVKAGADSLLADCGPAPGGGKPCARLGSSVYVSIEPVSMGALTGRVYAHVLWPDRGDCLSRGIGRNGRAALVGFSAEVYLARSWNGAWRFVKTGVYMVS